MKLHHQFSGGLITASYPVEYNTPVSVVMENVTADLKVLVARPSAAGSKTLTYVEQANLTYLLSDSLAQGNYQATLSLSRGSLIKIEAENADGEVFITQD